MDRDETSRRLADAEGNVARALLRLQQMRRAILNGEFDPQLYDQALLAYRQAEYDADDARQAWARARQAAQAAQTARSAPALVPAPDAAPVPGSGPTSAPAEAESFQPTERMRFVRWLVQQGRLSEWQAD